MPTSNRLLITFWSTKATAPETYSAGRCSRIWLLLSRMVVRFCTVSWRAMSTSKSTYLKALLSRDICEMAVMIMSLVATGTRPEKSGICLLVISVVGIWASRKSRSMHISESEKLDSERTGRVVGRSEACA